MFYPLCLTLFLSHAGDLGNIKIENGAADIYIMDRIVSLDPNSPFSIGGRGMVLHAGEDDFNPLLDPSSTGGAGSRVACCIISG